MHPMATTSTDPTVAGQMFDHFRQAKFRKLPPWAVPLFGGCLIFVFALLATMWVKTIWGIEQLDPPKTSVDLAVAPPPPPPPPPPPGGAKPHDVIITPKKHTVKDLVQIQKIEKVDQKQSNEQVGEVGGVEGGVEGG